MTPRHHKPAAARHPDIQHLSYQPEGLYPLDLEIFRVSDLRQRVGGEALASTYRYAFPTLIFVTQGTCLHLVDFEHVRCGPGSVLVLRPGKAHSFGDTQDWDGWMVLFRPEFLWAAAPAAQAQAPIDGLDGLPGPRAMVSAAVAADLCRRLYEGGSRDFHFYTLNRADQAYAICQLLGLRPKGDKTP